ncbi:MAG: ThiF family adenylyltransferase [Flavobacteriales bacterium]|nr:ThiF family adenylyltransferase [Flavobacteriales bacterium]MBP6698939.1 ThiF family adenylyltransferase [Flavobacteriales bacterium]
MSVKPTPHAVLMIGIGGIGHAFLRALQDHRPSHLTLVDGDTVSAHNLSRQPLFSQADIGMLKVEVARAALARSMPGTRLDTRPIFADRYNLPSLINGFSLVIDCTDDAHAKCAIDQACLEAGTPLISAAVHADQAQVMLLHASGAMGDPAITRGHLFSGQLGPGQDDCDMRAVPLEVLTTVGNRMAVLWDDLRSARDVMNGRVELLYGERWTMIAPPDRRATAWTRPY